MNGHGRLPIKVVPPMQEDFYRPTAGGGDPKVFGDPPSREFRARLAAEVIGIRDHFRDAFDLYPQVPAVARAVIRPDAVAKSHRPTRILSEQTCPIIGSEGLGELLLSVSRNGLERLARTIETDQTKYGIANLSTLEDLKPYEPAVDLPEESSDRCINPNCGRAPRPNQGACKLCWFIPPRSHLGDRPLRRHPGQLRSLARRPPLLCGIQLGGDR